MRIVLQRVSKAAVTVEKRVIGEIEGPGVVLLIGMGPNETQQELEFWASKCVNLRIFPDLEGKMNLSLKDVDGAVLAVSQFTLFGETRKGRRPGFSKAGPPEQAKKDYETFVQLLKDTGVRVETGEFQAHMHVDIFNDGPVTLLLGSDFQ